MSMTGSGGGFVGLITRLGLWLDKKFPSKMSVAEVQTLMTLLKELLDDHTKRIVEIENFANTLEKMRLPGWEKILEQDRIELQRLASEINTIKTITNIKSRVVGNEVKPVK